jgi:D-methionine transport system substrate-binding protein
MKQSILLTAGLFFLGCLSTYALKIGVTAGPHADILGKVKELAGKQGLTVDIVEFNDFIIPNEALLNKDLDINSFQHVAYLKAQCESRGYKFTVVGKTVVMPLGLYSTRIKSIDEMSPNARVALPNDPSNEGRALKLLAKAGVITVNNVLNPSLQDISANPKNLSFIEMEAPLLPRTLQDVEAALINTDWVLISGLDPTKAIYREDKDSDYANVLVVRDGDENREDILSLVKIYHSPDVKKFINETYGGAVIPAW